MKGSDRLGLLLALPGFFLAFAIGVYLTFAKVVCDPLYQDNALLDLNFLAIIHKGIAKEIAGSFSPPPHKGLAFYKKPSLPTEFCNY
jgi:hypothetical protein